MTKIVNSTSLLYTERDKNIIEDRIKGMTYRQLKDKYGLALSGLHGVIKKHMANTIRPAAEELVQLEVERLERMLLALDEKIEAGNVRAIEVGIKLSESLRKLTGVDAAIKTEMEVTINPATIALEEKLLKAKQLNAGDE